MGYDFNSFVQSFNRGTNTWVKNNIFRRLRWLDSKPLAHLITLMYLAIWHGYHLGYFLIFGLEFGAMMAQQEPVKSLYFIGYIFYFIIWPILYRVLLNILPLRKNEEECQATTDVKKTKTS
ncbi:hypothetical protein COOONC_16609 [Cooperia oncophora]